MNTEKSFKAEIVSIMDDVRTKKLKDGSEGQYLLTTVRFLDGVIKGKEYFAQRTLKAGKSPIHVGQKVTCYMSVANGNPFFEISTGGSVTDRDELKGLLGL